MIDQVKPDPDFEKLPAWPPMKTGEFEKWNESQAMAWGILWTWCHENGLSEHGSANVSLFRHLNGPQTIAQWILDLKGEAAR